MTRFREPLPMTVSKALAAHAAAQIAKAKQADAADRSAQPAGDAIVETGAQPFNVTWNFAATVIRVRR